MRDSGSAFINQYCLPSSSSALSQSDSFAVTPPRSSPCTYGSGSALVVLDLPSLLTPFGLPLGLPVDVVFGLDVAFDGLRVVALVLVGLAVDLAGLALGDFKVCFGLPAFFSVCLAVGGLLCVLTRVNLELGDFLGLPAGLPTGFAAGGVEGGLAVSEAAEASLRGLPADLLTGGSGAVSVVLIALRPGFLVGGGPILGFLVL